MTNEEIWELAAIHLTQTGETVADYTSPASQLQIVFNRLYQPAIDQTLEIFDWSFARKRVIPTELTATQAPPPEWTHTWTLPTDYLVFRGFGIQTRTPGRIPKISFEIARSLDDSLAQVLYTQIDPFEATYHLIYTKQLDPTDVAEFSPSFERALAAVLASRAAMPMGRDAAFEQALMNRAASEFAQSTQTDTRQEKPRRTQPMLVEARNT